ncbi:SSS family solute:Na+ symporter [Rhizodiscina lignyota]|uniref:SSS family solute:Na+ symporter n=1 Tax=Rhizodiscina lignyota TaxID=1504668 RepID=A0A9P4IRC4_9PEZI|nr:SSS family solute:Na+ symporter [Rhizodiscina lignyota]
MAASDLLLSQGTGYGILIGLAVVFCLIILTAVRIQRRYLQEETNHSEMFMVANRSVGVGLTASAVFSSWMWIDETVFACTYAYWWAVSAPVWYASGLSCQIALMAFMGIIAKLRVPHAHTSMEFIGMHPVAVAFIIPIGVMLYTAVGGLKATFLTDYFHTTIALILLIFFTLSILTNEHIGGIGGLYDTVKALDVRIDGNYKGSLLSFKSHNAIIWGVVLRIGNLALVVMDTAFWQKSFASEVSATVPGYNLASIAILAVPWTIGTVVGLACRVIEHTPIFVTYPEILSDTDVGNGLVLPYVLKSLLGNGATKAFLVLTFMAVTSTVSSSMIAVSSILSFDFFKTHFKPNASDRQILTVSHLGVVAYGFLMAGWTLMMTYSGANGNWSTYFLPVVTCPGICPLLLTLLWSRQTKLAAVLSPILGLAGGLGIWLGLSKRWYGAITIATTSQQMPSLWGSLISLFGPLLFSIIISLARPQRFDWREFLKMDLIEDETPRLVTPISGQGSSLAVNEAGVATDERSKHPEVELGAVPLPIPEQMVRPELNDIPVDQIVHPFDEKTMQHVKKWLKIATIFLIVNWTVTVLLWPLPLHRDYVFSNVFSKSFFGGWVTVAIIWQFFALFAVVVYPLWDGRHVIAKAFRGVVKDIKIRKGLEVNARAHDSL